MLCSAWGALGGILVLLSWRYVQPPRYGETIYPDGVSIPPNTETYFTVDSPVFFSVVPAWIAFPVIGVILGFTLGCLFEACGLHLLTKDKSRTSTWTWLICVLLGVATGIAAASALQWSPPPLFINSRPAVITGIPSQLDLSPIWLVLPLLGLVLGFAVGGVTRKLGLSISHHADEQSRG